MKLTNKYFNRLLIVALAALAFLSSCNDDDEILDASNGDYVLSTFVTSADMMSTASYAQVLDLASAGISYDNSTAVEIGALYGPAIFPYGGSMYYNKYQAYTLEKWDVDESGYLTQTGSIDFSDLGYQCNITYLNDEVAFTGGPNDFKVAIFNPSTMTRTGSIDLSAYSKLDSITGFPTDNASVGMQSPSEIIIRDNYMYVAVYYCTSGAGDWTPVFNDCRIIVVDLDKVDYNSTGNADAVVKEIVDDRGSYTGAWACGYGSSFMILDDNNDIYMLCHNMWGMYESISGLPACALRIKDGETEFDDSYYFDMEAASGGAYHAVMGFEYAGGTKLFAASMDPNKIDPDNAWSYYTDPLHQWYQFDLSAQTATLVSDVYTKGAAASFTLMEDGYAYIPMVTADENYIMKTNISTLETEKLFSTVGAPIITKLD
ncbi:DUF4374 domain-containing protein [Saccharicrinis fermentans]|uniref:DUF4374 domain-containing protein n=1 Tax=Saccharicrinis fermentans DSM 9555 = JCM 21142 TaxID=869213 RepID=W7YAR8_9BACT|nr:DUF4374 domain-containing protein [Saccharicrinis fermentans]GAF04678.1 hypothetical protein JCM21142_93393 [Saccharicrinis fermentans DSM 9555 = JCM 21142]